MKFLLMIAKTLLKNRNLAVKTTVSLKYSLNNYRVSAIWKINLFKKFNETQLLAIVTEASMLDVAVALDPHLKY